ncbi:MAG: hypothetical protein PHE17_11035 [Thiothrix sp.]|uniref:hypothetical protein n=1 Tax=Thiothrix sp. TaxID=1032 RepID=UPI0026286846|nr:hypothetical protein [Thiothrix sp.]MDD5393541.1 hypothetical protein [Thiothrix sp.]
MKRILLLALAFLLSLSSAVYFFGPCHKQVASVLTLQQPCDLHAAPCLARDAAGHAIRFSLSPATLPVMQELTANAELQGLGGVTSARLTVEGANMYMGYQYAELKAAEPANELRGKFILPVCSTEKMQWKATVSINSPTNSFSAVFPFETIRR